MRGRYGGRAEVSGGAADLPVVAGGEEGCTGHPYGLSPGPVRRTRRAVRDPGAGGLRGSRRGLVRLLKSPCPQGSCESPPCQEQGAYERGAPPTGRAPPSFRLLLVSTTARVDYLLR